MKEWDYEKNDTLSLDPFSLGISSHTKAWWKCNEGHSWYSSISNRTRKGHMNGCPYCAHQLLIPGETDLETLYPELAKQWHPTKNKLKPSEVMPGTHKKAWWICDKGHEWEAQIKSRVTGVSCPYCSNKKVLYGFNDLATINPDLAKEWHPTKNGDLTPSDVTPSSGKKVWWKCSFGHEWEAQICNRNAGRGCPECSDSLRTSFPEQAIFYYIKQVFPDAISSYKDIFKSSMELDIYIPTIKVGIEYDGKTYHSDSKNQIRDAKKYKICKENGIILIRIREMSRYTPITMCDHKIEIPDASDKYLNWAINKLCYHLGKNVVPDVRRDRNEILSYLNNKKVSLASEFPEIAAEWDYKENYPLIPENFPPHSNERVGWKCKDCGHKWKAAIGDRTGEDKNGCPVCAKKRGGAKRVRSLVKKNGSLASLYPELLEEWDFEKNSKIGLDPYSITPGSGKKANWICKKCEYSWSTTINHRIHGRGCPYCAGKAVVTGKNDLAILKPDLMKEWDYEKNNMLGLDPKKLPVRTAKKAYWICSVCGNRWKASICSRSAGSGCPYYRYHDK
ncbi:MAG: zinc-ribbon domain-containing protein [Erysipelotrichaceae bacterium]|nr:zinc-ribbon domain-containing protein [Erysipelotrichaceae bacterium]